MRLLSVELRRFYARRSNIVIVVLGLLFLSGSLAVVAINSHPPSPSELTEAEAEAESDRSMMAAEAEECRQWWQDNPDGRVDQADPDWEYGDLSGPEECGELYGPEGISSDNYLVGVMSFETEAPAQLVLLTAILVVAGLLMASSFIGAEWTSGGMTNLLLWNPRRLPVMSAKVTAVMTCVTALTLIYTAFHMGSLYLIAHFDGRPGNLDSAWWQENSWFALRMMVIVLLTTLCGAALSMIGRRTITAIGIVLGYVVLVEIAIRGMLQSVNLDISGFLLSTYLHAWIAEGITIHDGITMASNHPSDSFTRYGADVFYISTWAGGGVLLAVTVALLGLASWTFARRDTA